jgi:hypothetical protein
LAIGENRTPVPPILTWISDDSRRSKIFLPPLTHSKETAAPRFQSINANFPQTRTHYPESAMKPFTAQQITVLQALAAGATVTAAAQLANVSRPTVYAWSDNPAFQQALAFAQQEYALTLRDRLQSLTAKALDKLEQVLDHPKASPSVILRATILLLTNKKWNLPTVEDCAPAIDAAADRMEADPEIMANEAAYEEQLTKLYTKSDSAPQTPRNAPCPCGSGQKYKRCCGKTAPPVLHR